MGKYDINKIMGAPDVERGWCGYRPLIIMGVVISVIIYTVGAIITGVTYKDWDIRANCSRNMSDGTVTNELYKYSTPVAVVGPALMSAGGAIVTFMILQWHFCRPTFWR